MITILLQKILAVLTQLLGDIKTKLNTIKDNLDDLIIVATASGPIASFTTTITKPFISFIVDIPESESGTDTVVITQTGKNLFDPSVYNSFLQLDGKYNGVANSVVAVKTNLGAYIGKQLTFSIYADLTVSPTPTNVKVAVNINGVTTSGNAINSGNAGYSSVTFIPQTENDFILISFGSNGGNSFTFYDIQLEASSTRTAYEPYSATTKTVSLPSTVYGGEVDITDLIMPEIKAINGVNNIFTDSGDVTVDYLKLYKED